MKNNRHTKAFTLIELMVTIGIAAVLMAVALPSFNRMMENSRLTSTANTLIGAYNIARSEAISRSTNVVVKQSATAWQVFQVDTNELIKSLDINDNGITFAPTSIADVIYSSTGFRPATNRDEITINLTSSGGLTRTIVVSASGMSKVN